MQSAHASELEKIIDSRSKKELVIGGEYFAFIGLTMMLVMALNVFVFSGWWVWIAGIAFVWMGIVTIDVLSQKKKGKYSTRVQNEIFTIWLGFGLIVCPLVVVVFPAFFKIYPSSAIMPVILLIMGYLVWLTGVIAKSIVFKLGALAFITGSFLGIFYRGTLEKFLIFNLVMIAGLVIPGILSKYNEKRG